jgi:hypothetical protein
MRLVVGVGGAWAGNSMNLGPNAALCNPVAAGNVAQSERLAGHHMLPAGGAVTFTTFTMFTCHFTH